MQEQNAKLSPLIRRITQWMLTPATTLSLTIVGIIALYAGLINYIIFLIAIVLLLIAQLVRLVRALCDIASGKRKSNRHLAITGVAIAVPILLILNMREIDYIGTYLAVRVIEPYVLSKAETIAIKHSDKNSRFKYFRLSFGGAAANKRWLVYDESGQVSLDYQKRNEEWWRVSKEFEEREGCATNGRRLYSNFYIQYYSC